MRTQGLMRIGLLPRLSQSFAFIQPDFLEFAQTRHVPVFLPVSILTRSVNKWSCIPLKVVYTKSTPLGIAQAGHFKDEQSIT
jgi:hypothetical protein